jgi:hypothetical protein
MRYLKLFISALMVFAVLLSIISWLMPSKIMLVRTVMVAADRQDIQFQFADLRNWRNWNPYFRDMPAESMVLADSNRLVWLENDDSMKMTLDGISDNQALIKLEREGAYPMNNSMSILEIDDSPGWQVEWRVTASLPWYPWERFAAIFFDKTAGPSFEEALASLKAYCEKNN